MTVTREQITAMLKGLDGVTAGPWSVEMHGPSPVLYSGRGKLHGLNLLRLSDGDWNFDNNIAHIARCDPSTIRALCELALKQLKDEVSIKREVAEEIAELHRAGEALRAENGRLRAALSQIALYTDKPECFEIADMANAALKDKAE